MIINYVDFSKNRLDSFLFYHTGIKTRSHWQRIINNGSVLVNGQQKPKDYLLTTGDIITIESLDVNNQERLNIKPADIDMEVVFENKNLIVINKPSNLVTHPGPGNWEGTMLNGVIKKWGDELSKISGNERPGIVHRLDKDTSGLIIVAKNNEAHFNVSNQIQNKTCKRRYLAICHGVMSPTFGTIETLISPSKKDNRIMTVPVIPDKLSREAITDYKTISIYKNGSASLVEFSLKTGRTHQIRLHCLHKKHPILGDKVYNNDKYRYKNNSTSSSCWNEVINFPRQALHSYYLSLVDIDGKEIELSIDLPDDMKKIIKILSE